MEQTSSPRVLCSLNMFFFWFFFFQIQTGTSTFFTLIKQLKKKRIRGSAMGVSAVRWFWKLKRKRHWPIDFSVLFL